MKIYISSVTGRVTFCLLLLTLPMLVFCQYYYSGLVYNKYTEQPIPGVNIRVTNLDSNNKLIANTSTNTDGRYSFSMQYSFNIRITATSDGFKKFETSYTPAQLQQFEGYLPHIYLDTTLKFIIVPEIPVRQSRALYTDTKLKSIRIVPTPAAYDLLDYLNPDLKYKDSLMSNDNLVLPVMPVLSNGIKSANKQEFRDLNRKDGQIQNQLRDTADKLIRILADDVMNYKIKYDGADKDRLIVMREYLKADIEAYKSEISNTPKLKAQTLMQLMSSLSQGHEMIIANRFLSGPDFEYLRTLWEDLSYMISRSRYQYFINRNMKKRPTGFLPVDKDYPVISGPSISGNEKSSATELNVFPAVIDEQSVPKSFADETALFGFLIWSPELTSQVRPDLTKPSNRYVVRYFIWAYRNNKNEYIECKGNANTALANLTRARYGVEVYDMDEQRVVETLYPDFRTDAALDDRQLDNFLIPDFKEVKFILIRLK